MIAHLKYNTKKRKYLFHMLNFFFIPYVIPFKYKSNLMLGDSALLLLGYHVLIILQSLRLHICFCFD